MEISKNEKLQNFSKIQYIEAVSGIGVDSVID